MKRLLLSSVVLLSACSSSPPSSPLEALRQEVWVEAPYVRLYGDWEAKKEGDCKNKSLFIRDTLEPLGYNVTFLFGCRVEHIPDEVCSPEYLHMAPVVDGTYVIDYDRVWKLEDYPLVPYPYQMPN